MLFRSALSSIRQETYFLNPLLDNDTLYKDFNDTYDYDDYNTDYDNYETSDDGESSTIPYYEENTGSVDRGIHYASSTIANFLTDSTTVEHSYTSSTSSRSKTTAFESNTMEGILHFLSIVYFTQLTIIQVYCNNYIILFDLYNCLGTISSDLKLMKLINDYIN